MCVCVCGWRLLTACTQLTLLVLSCGAVGCAFQAGAGAATLTTSADSKAPRRIKVYTKTGDKGSSSLYNGSRATKSSDVFAALGDTDELNAALGMAREFLGSYTGSPDAKAALVSVSVQLETVQSRLLDVGSAVATPLSSSTEEQLARTAFADAHVEQLEAWIDAMDEQLPPLRNFILPSGGLAAAQLHVARTVCRRAERSVVDLVGAGDTPPVVGKYLNRLSDYLFTAARFAASKAGREETVYKKA